MSLGKSSFDGTVQQIELWETNKEQRSRGVFLKCRKLGGKRGKLVRMSGSVVKLYKILRTEDEDEAHEDTVHIDMKLTHWGVQVGPYLWELHTDNKHANTLSLQRLTGDQIWEADKRKVYVGQTTLTDKEVDQAAYEAFQKMKGKNEGRYDIVDNNCQDFVVLIINMILEDGGPISFSDLRDMACDDDEDFDAAY